MNKKEMESKFLEMDQSEYMNKEQLSYFKFLLEKKYDLNTSRIAKLKKEIDELDNNGKTDQIDQANTLNDLSMLSRETTRLNNENKQIKSALERIKNNEYGYCINTGEEIGLKRLFIAPETPYCIEELQRIEIVNKQYGK